MGDRTYAWVKIQTEYWPLVVTDTGEHWHDAYPEGVTEVIVNYEANYGNMEGVTTLLEELQIPYDHGWDQGDDFGVGRVYQRFNPDGSSPWVKFFEEDRDKVPIATVQQWLEEYSLPKVLEFLTNEAKKYQPPNNQQLEDCPIREFTPEEAVIIMQYKMENAK
jgi:hypothetical protein